MHLNQFTDRHSPAKHFPWRTGNSFELLINAVQFVPAMLAAINDATKFVCIEMYLIESSAVTDDFIQTIVDAATRTVSVYLLMDDFGSRGLSKKDRSRLEHKFIHILFYNPLRWPKLKHYVFRDHRKLLLVDGVVALTGSAGIIAANDPTNNNSTTWRETMVEIRGPVVKDWLDLFETVWNRSNPQPLQLQHINFLGNTHSMHGRTICSRPMRKNAILNSAIKHGLQAKKYIWMATAYFVPPRKLRRMLRSKAKQNIDVRILLPGNNTDHPSVRFSGHYYYARLLRAGVRIFEYQPSFMHSKTLLCDDWCSVGSCNFDRWNLHRNLEANQEIMDSSFAIQVKTMFEADFNHCQEIHYGEWQNRPFRQRIKAWFWNLVSTFIEKERSN